MKRVCVFCGSSSGARTAYGDSARRLGGLLAERGIGLVYGGGHIGLMGVLADAVLAGGGEVVGVIPQALVDMELAHAGLSELRIVATMHERKALMADLADGFIALPGGYGTADELFEMLTWAQLGIHAKPIGLVNVEGYFDALLAWLEHTVREKLVRPEHKLLLIHAAQAEDVLQAMRDFRLPEGSGKLITQQDR